MFIHSISFSFRWFRSRCCNKPVKVRRGQVHYSVNNKLSSFHSGEVISLYIRLWFTKTSWRCCWHFSFSCFKLTAEYKHHSLCLSVSHCVSVSLCVVSCPQDSDEPDYVNRVIEIQASWRRRGRRHVQHKWDISLFLIHLILKY